MSTQYICLQDRHVPDEFIQWTGHENTNVPDPYHADTPFGVFETNGYVLQSRWNLWTEIIRSLQQNKISSLIDIGAAEGVFVWRAFRAGIDAHGIEPRVANVIQARSKIDPARTRMFVGSVETFIADSKDQTDPYECVTLLNYVHGVWRDPSVLEDTVQTLLQKARYIVMTMPSNVALAEKIFDSTHVLDHFDPGPHYLLLNKRFSLDEDTA
jgi:hypothetical protein